MKKIVCLALCFLYILNVGGGYWLLVRMQYQNNKELAAKLDIDSYSGSNVITIKLPIESSKSTDNENYERVDGEFEHDGIVYRMVKQKFYRDTVYVVCYKDKTAGELKTAMKDYLKSFTDRPAEKKSSDKNHGDFIKDYLFAVKAEATSDRTGVDIARSFSYNNSYKQFYFFSVDHPPQLIS